MAFLGEARGLVLVPLSRYGVLQTMVMTCCPSGRSVVEALGFEQVHHPHADESSFYAPVQFIVQCPADCPIR